MRKVFRSLQAKYMLIIVMALFLVQTAYLMIAIILTISNGMWGQSERENSFRIVEENWHEEASSLAEVTEHHVHQLFERWKLDYPQSSMFWVDDSGLLRIHTDDQHELPEHWSASFTAKFIKARYNGDPFTVIAFAGADDAQGFVVFEIPRSAFEPPLIRTNNQYGTWLLVGTLLVIFVFIIVSYLFFRGIRRRLLHLQEAMSIRDTDGLPIQIQVKKLDEIGQLEQSFNEMVQELKDSRQREREEEQLRRELIANLSHDLRTPLTKIRAQTFAIGKSDKLPADAAEAVQAIERSVISMDRLIDNLMSYTLLMANKYRLEAEQVDVVRLVREHLAGWYPAFERENFTVDVDLQPLGVRKWHIDPLWMERVLDNLYQNVLRHAKSGRYIRVSTQSTEKYDALIIADRGGGITSTPSEEKGAGVGLSIVDRMVAGMNLDWELESIDGGTVVKVIRYRHDHKFT